MEEQKKNHKQKYSEHQNIQIPKPKKFSKAHYHRVVKSFILMGDGGPTTVG